MFDDYRNHSFIEQFQNLYGFENSSRVNTNRSIIYQVYRYPNDNTVLRYVGLVKLAPDVILMYLLGILIVRRDLHIIGILVGVLPCLLANLYHRSSSAALLCYFAVYLCCFKCLNSHHWQRGLRSLRSRRTSFVVFVFLVALAAIAANICFEEITLNETIFQLIGGSCWGVCWWKIHRKYAPNIYTRLARHWLFEILMIRNTCWISDLTAFECHYEMMYFRKYTERLLEDTFLANYNVCDD